MWVALCHCGRALGVHFAHISPVLDPACVLPAPRRYVGTQCKYNKQLADLGMHCYLKMLLKVGQRAAQLFDRSLHWSQLPSCRGRNLVAWPHPC